MITRRILLKQRDKGGPGTQDLLYRDRRALWQIGGWATVGTPAGRGSGFPVPSRSRSRSRATTLLDQGSRNHESAPL
jgi:hypothetical protein